MPQGRGTTTTGNHQQAVFGRVIYSRRADESGWLNIILADGRASGVCEYTRAILLRQANGRIYYRIDDEGSPYNGLEANSKESTLGQFWVADPPTIDNYVVRVKYQPSSTEYSDPRNESLLQEWGRFTVDGRDIRVTLNSEPRRGYTRLPVGTHKIMRPDYSHGVSVPTVGYVDYVKTNLNGECHGNDSWFPIEINGLKTKRYVHIGHLSDGCITVYELESWSYIYDYLISKRQGNHRSKYIADLIVEA